MKVCPRDMSYKRSNIVCDLPNCGCNRSTMIWISHGLKAIYFETPKTASSSIKKALNIAVEKPDKINILNISKKRKWWFSSNHTAFEMWDDNEYEAIENYPDYFTFAIVRNPWDKMVSNWMMFCRSGIDFRERQIETLFGKDATIIEFDEFIRMSVTIRNHHWQQLVDYLPREGDKILVDYIGRMETLADDWRGISRKIGLRATLGAENQTSHKDYRKYYCDELINIVAMTHKDDIRIFNFKF